MRGIYLFFWLRENLLVSQEGLCSMNCVSKLFIKKPREVTQTIRTTMRKPQENDRTPWFCNFNTNCITRQDVRSSSSLISLRDLLHSSQLRSNKLDLQHGSKLWVLLAVLQWLVNVSFRLHPLTSWWILSWHSAWCRCIAYIREQQEGLALDRTDESMMKNGCGEDRLSNSKHASSLSVRSLLRGARIWGWRCGITLRSNLSHGTTGRWSLGTDTAVMELERSTYLLM